MTDEEMRREYLAQIAVLQARRETLAAQLENILRPEIRRKLAVRVAVLDAAISDSCYALNELRQSSWRRIQGGAFLRR